MRQRYGNPAATLEEIQGAFVPGRDVFVGPSRLGSVCKLLWPHKTAAHLASIAKRDERTAKRWLSGEFEPPGCIYAAIFVEITKRD